MSDILEEAIRKYDPTHVIAMFSGGPDSQVATHIVKDHPRFSFVCHINTGIGIPQTREFVRKTVEEWGVPFKEYRAAENLDRNGNPDPQIYEEMVLQYGFPGPPMHKKMYNRLKERPLRQMIRELDRERSDRVILVTGVRSDESLRRMAHVEPIQEFENTKIWVAPIWDWSKADVYAYMDEHGLRRNPVSSLLHMSGECLCGAFSHEGELAEIRSFYPETAAEIERIQEKVMEKFPWGWEDRPPPWWLDYNDGQDFIPGLEPEILCTGCAYREETA